MSATMLGMGKQTRPVRLNPDVAERIRLIAVWMTDTNFRQDGQEVTMGDLIARALEPIIEKHLPEAVKHDIKKKKELLG